MSLHELAGKPVPREMLVNVPRLVAEYYTRRPDPANPAEGVSFGTSGHRGSSLKGSFNEAHVLAIVQAVCDRRASERVAGPLVLGMRHPRPLRAGVRERPRGARGQRRRDADPGGGGATRPRRWCRTPSSARTAGATPRLSPTGSSSPPPTTPPRTAGSSTTRRTAGRPTPGSPAASRSGRTRCWPPASPACAGCRSTSAPSRPRRPTRTTTCMPYVGDLENMRRPEVDRPRRT